MTHFIGALFAISSTLNVVQLASLDTLYFKSDKIICPDGSFTCDDQSTCCQLPNNEWACCVFPNAQCCSDRTHCCPQGSTCDAAHKSCHSSASNFSVPAVRTKSRTSSIAAVKPEFTDLVGLYCPDRTTCPYAGAACCRTFSGRYSCCNYPLNVCCDDGLHCCHIGTVCDPIRYVCIPYPGSNTTWTQSWTAMTPAYHHSPTAGVGGDSDVLGQQVVSSESKPPTSKCREGHTCCADGQGNEGLCVLHGTAAVCCDDGLHCCPQGSTCDLEKSQCTFQNMQAPVTPWSRKAGPSSSHDTVCPDGESQCDDGFTCCPQNGNRWGCCPLSSAVCCSDMRHCCPQGTNCTPQGTCETSLQSRRIPWSALVYEKDSHN